MKLQSVDRWLLGIVGGAVVLVVVALAVALSRAAPEYREGSEPDDIVFNYLLAIQRDDFDRAYSYLSPDLPGYPDSARAMRADLRRSGFSETDSSYAIIDTVVRGDQATVTVRETRVAPGGLFGSSQFSSTFTMDLQRTDAGWRLVSGSGWQFWMWCWEQKEGC